MKLHLCLLLIIALMVVVFGDVPHLISYQGRITESPSGDPVPDGSYPITFRIYDSAAGGGSLWQETYASVPVTDGLYAVRLGSINPFPHDLDFSTPYWLEIVFGSETLSPRYQLTSAPYALNIADSIVKPVGLVVENPNLDMWDHSFTHIGADSIGVRIFHYYEDMDFDIGGAGLDVIEGLDFATDIYSRARLGWLSAFDLTAPGGFVNIAVYGQVGPNGGGGGAIVGVDDLGDYGDGDYAGYFLGDVYIDGDLEIAGGLPSGQWTRSGAAPYIYANGNTDVQVWDTGAEDYLVVRTLTTTAGEGAIYAEQGVSHAGGYPSEPYSVYGNSDDGYGVVGHSLTAAGVYGRSIENDGVYGYSENSFGVHGWSASSTEAGIYGYNSGGGWAGKFDGNVDVLGNLRTDGGIKLTLNGTDFVGSSQGTSDCEVQYQNNASAVVHEASTDAQGIVMASIPFPSQFLGYSVVIDSIRIYYKTEESADYIDITTLRENTFDGSYTTLTQDNTNYTSTSISSFLFNCDDIISVTTKGVYLLMNIHYDTDGGDVTIYGAEVYIHQL